MSEPNGTDGKWLLYDRDEVGLTFDMTPFSPIGVIEKEVDIHDHIKLNGQIYSCCQLSHKEKYAVIRKITLGGEHDTEYTSHAICPHCGYEDIDCFEWSDDDNRECGICDLPFKSVREVEITYSTEKIGKSKKKHLNAVGI